MKARQTNHEFPTKDPRFARQVLDLPFDIRPYLSGTPDLYVDLDGIRGSAFRERFFDLLGIVDGEINAQRPPLFEKIMLYGHRGAGKSIELWHLKDEVQQKGGFKVLFIEADSDLAYGGSFSWEDFFQLLLNTLVRECSEADLRAVDGLRELAKEYLGEQEIMQEINLAFHSERDSSSKDTNWFWRGLSDPKKFGLLYTQNATTTQVIRRKIEKMTSFVVDIINQMLDLARTAAEKEGFRDVLLIFDGTEKVGFGRYKNLFLHNAEAIQRLNCHLICGVPIAARYELQGSAQQSIYKTVILPLFHLKGKEQVETFGKIITQRLDRETFVEDEALWLGVEKSGGFPRQLLRIFYFAFVFYAKGGRITREHVQKAVTELGAEMWDRLRPNHKTVISKARGGSFAWDMTDTNLELIDELVLMKYNGTVAVNPLLDEFLL